jgi:beta-carotene hydroxylase
VAIDAPRQAVPRVARELRGVPDLAPWRNPTLGLFVADVALLVAGTAGYVRGTVPAGVTIALHTLAFYLGFTVLHESVHRLVHKNRVLNDILGWPTAMVFTVTQTTFRAVHLMHHSKTNDPEQDPDFAVGQGPWWQRPARVLSPLWEYRVKYYRNRLWRERWELAVQLAFDAALIGVIALCAATGHFGDLLVLWLAPALISVAFLAYTFDYLPHKPYDSRERFLDTRAYPSRVLNVVLLGQNYHLIHHAWNTIVWYRYQQAFEDAAPEMKALGARIAPLGQSI